MNTVGVKHSSRVYAAAVGGGGASLVSSFCDNCVYDVYALVICIAFERTYFLTLGYREAFVV